MTVQQAIEKRFSMRNFNTNKKVSRQDIEMILRAGQKAPNGLGFEAWKFYVVENNLDIFASKCNNQQHVSDCAFSIVLAAPSSEEILRDNTILVDKVVDNGLSKETAIKYVEYLSSTNIGQYLREQTFFAASQMVMQATGLEIGSVVIGGFDSVGVKDFINCEKGYDISLVVCFGYGYETLKERYNKPLDEIVTYL